MKKLIAITGASSGIGAALAHAFSEAGHPLLLMARRVDELEKLDLPNTVCAKVDVTVKDDFEAAIKKAEALYGPVDALINNAGVMLLGQTDTQSPEEWQTMLNVNVMGVLNGVHSVLANMKKRQSGTIINVSSVAGRKTFPNHAAYVASKFAVSALTENIREEVALDNVRVMNISPGATETELLSHTKSEEIKSDYNEWKDSIGGVMNANNVADAALFAYQQPQNVNIREMVIAATKQQP